MKTVVINVAAPQYSDEALVVVGITPAVETWQVRLKANTPLTG